MLPTLKSGDVVLVFRWWPKSFLRTQQIIVFQRLSLKEQRDLNIKSRTLYIKRIIGQPGSTVKTNIDELNSFYRNVLFRSHDKTGLTVRKDCAVRQ
jgi:signal peptidase I